MEDTVSYIVTIARLPFTNVHQENSGGVFRLPMPEGNENTTRESVSVPKQPRSKSAWLFQSNPVLYDLRGALRFVTEQVWTVSRYAKEIERGDRVYLWEAGREGGIAGVAEITEPAGLRPEPPEQLPFARVAAAFAGERLRARLRILRVVEPIMPRRLVASTPELSELAVLRCSRGTNFRLSLDQWQGLNSLIVGEA